MEKELTNTRLLEELISIIELSKQDAAIHVNRSMTMSFWQIGKRIKTHILKSKRAAYGEQVIALLSKDLSYRYGRSFKARNLRRMVQFSEVFSDPKIVTTLSSQLSWSHFILLFPIKEKEKRSFYAERIASERWSVRHAQKQIEKKLYERSEIGNAQFSVIKGESQSIFKDPYLLEFLELRSGYLENDLESAILANLEQFILELGMGFTFVERQKRMIIDGEDYYLDLLFYHRKLKRLVAIELKIGKFKASHKGQMELYLKWLDKYDKQEGENEPIGLILCAETSREQVELLELHKDGIMVAEYWTDLPPKNELEQRLHQALVEARERMNLRNLTKS